MLNRPYWSGSCVLMFGVTTDRLYVVTPVVLAAARYVCIIAIAYCTFLLVGQNDDVLL
jgi:hypothetical protein